MYLYNILRVRARGILSITARAVTVLTGGPPPCLGSGPVRERKTADKNRVFRIITLQYIVRMLGRFAFIGFSFCAVAGAYNGRVL